MLAAVKYYGPVGLGATSPQFFQANDGHFYVVKLQNNRLGPKVLANELLATRFGDMMGLCFPDGDVITIDSDVLRQSRRLSAAGVQPGPHFACRYLKGTQYVGRQNLYKAVNVNQMAGVMLFDHMFHNLDRTYNRKNLLIRRETNGYKLYAIDNSHLFKRGKWTVEMLERLMTEIKINHFRSYGLLLKHFLTVQDFEQYVAIVEQLDEAQIDAIIKTIPEEWIFDQAERQALQAFIVKRCQMVRDIAAPLCRLVPD